MDTQAFARCLRQRGKAEHVVAELSAQARCCPKQVEYLVFADEGHDVLKFPNKVRCYNAITDFFTQHLQP